MCVCLCECVLISFYDFAGSMFDNSVTAVSSGYLFHFCYLVPNSRNIFSLRTAGCEGKVKEFKDVCVFVCVCVCEIKSKRKIEVQTERNRTE